MGGQLWPPFFFLLDCGGEGNVTEAMTKALNAPAARDALQEVMTDLLEQGLEILSAEGREARAGELALLTTRLALFGRAAAEAHALS